MGPDIHILRGMMQLQMSLSHQPARLAMPSLSTATRQALVNPQHFFAVSIINRDKRNLAAVLEQPPPMSDTVTKRRIGKS
jgi:hypothetical protein